MGLQQKYRFPMQTAQRPNFSAIANEKQEVPQKQSTLEKAFNTIITVLAAVLVLLFVVFMMSQAGVLQNYMSHKSEATRVLNEEHQQKQLDEIISEVKERTKIVKQVLKDIDEEDKEIEKIQELPIVVEDEVERPTSVAPVEQPTASDVKISIEAVDDIQAVEKPVVEPPTEQLAEQPTEQPTEQTVDQPIETNDTEQLVQVVEDVKREMVGQAIFMEQTESTETEDLDRLDDDVPITFFLEKVQLDRQQQRASFLEKSKASRKESLKYETRKATSTKSDADFLQRPDIDHHEYRYFELDNKLKVLLVRDSGAQMSEAAMNVLAGSWDEPSTFPGLAHFLEHMLFQGSHTYPQNEYFDQLIESKGGETNAYTENSNTNFYFSVDTDTLERALTVFSHFFIDPMLSDDTVAKEVNAVNSEYEIDVSSDSWKIMNLISLLSDSKHPSSRFTIGNSDTLKQEGVIRALKDFYRNHYSSNQMALVVRTNQNLDKLEEFIAQSDFTKIEDGDLMKHDLASLGFPITEQLGSVVKFNVDSASKQVVFGYQLPTKFQDYHTKSLNFVDEFVTSAQVGSLRDYIVKEALGTGLDSTVFLDEPAFQFYLIEVQLESENTKPYDQRQLAYRLAKVCSNYFQLLEKSFFDETTGEPTEYLKEMWQEQASLSQTKFRYMQDGSDSPLNDIFFLSNSLNTNSLEEVLSGEFLMKEFNADSIRTALQTLANADNLVIFVGDSEYQFKEIAAADQSGPILAHQAVDATDIIQNVAEPQETSAEAEPTLAEIHNQKGSSSEDLKFLESNNLKNRNTLYHLDYSTKKMTKQTVDFISLLDDTITAKFVLPQKNDFVPTDLKLISTCTEAGVDTTTELLDDGQLHIRLDAQNDRLLQGSVDHKDIYMFLDQSPPQTITLQMSDIDDTIEMIETAASKSSDIEERLNMFVVTDPVSKESLEFTSFDECRRQELEFDSHQQYAQLVSKQNEGRMWWKIDRTYEVPAVFAGVRIDTSLPMKTAKDQALISLLREYVADQMQEELNLAFESGYQLEITATTKSLNLVAYGWSEQFERFFNHALHALNPHDQEPVSFLQVQRTASTPEQQRFNRVKGNLQVQLRDSFEENLYTQAIHLYLPLVMQHPYVGPADQYKQLKTLTFADLQAFRNDFFKDIHYSLFFAGNIDKSSAMQYVDNVKDSIHYDVANTKDKSHQMQIINIKGKSIVYAFQSKASDEQDVNGVTLNYYQIGKRTEKQFALMATLQGLLQSQAYSYLRTKKQLGYVVVAQFRPMGCVDGAQILVQGSEKTPYEVNEEIEYFLQGFSHQLNKMSDKFFANLKQGAIASLSNEPKSLYDEGETIWSHISRGDLAFEEKQAAAVAIEKLTKKELINFYETVFKTDSGKLSIQIYGKGMQQNQFQSLSADEFKRQLSGHVLSAQETYARRDEKIVFSNTDLSEYIDSAFSCDYRLGGV